MPLDSTTLYIDVEAIKYNLQQIQNFVGSNVEVMPVVKANAYGAGVEIVAEAVKGSDFLAVADAKEAVKLRQIFPQKNIFILYQPFISDIPAIVEQNFIVSACNFEFIKKLNDYAKKLRKTTKIHIKIDTGITRLGIFPEDAFELAEKIKNLKNIKVSGICMHYARADSFLKEDVDFCNLQTERFNFAIKEIEKVLGKIKYKHACAGDAIFIQPNAHFNMVRPGYIIYGYYPFPVLKEKISLKPALKLTSKIRMIKEVTTGIPVSYGGTFVTNRKTKIAVVSIGYSDGLDRLLSNKGYFVVNGQKAPIIGRICMDSTMIDITDIKGKVSTEDEISIFDNVNVTIEDIAKICNTIGYEVISRISKDVERIKI